MHFLTTVLLLSIGSGLVAETAAPTKPLECEQAPLTKKEKKRWQAKVRDSHFFKKILQLQAHTTTVTIDRCNTIHGSVLASHIAFDDIYGKKCSINSITFLFQEVDDQVQFDRSPFQDPSQSNNLSRKSLKASLESLISKAHLKGFFSNNKFCQVEYVHQPRQSFFVIQLRSPKNKYCFIKGSVDGTEAEILARRYAKNSECKQDVY